MPAPEAVLDPSAIVLRMRPFDPASVVRQAQKSYLAMMDEPEIPDDHAIPCISVFVGLQTPGETVDETCARLVECAQAAGLTSDLRPKVRAATLEDVWDAGWYLIKEGFPGEPEEHYASAPRGNALDEPTVAHLMEVLTPRTW